MIRSLDEQFRRSRRRNTTFAERVRWVQRLRQSGLSQQAFARQHRLSLSTLHVWIRQSEQGKPASAPVLREVPMPGLLSPWAAEVSRPDGLTVRLSAQFAREVLAKLFPGAC